MDVRTSLRCFGRKELGIGWLCCLALVLVGCGQPLSSRPSSGLIEPVVEASLEEQERAQDQQPESTPSPFVWVSQQRRLFVVMGGWGSCGRTGWGSLTPRKTGMYEPAQRLLAKAKAKTGESSHWIVSCFGMYSSRAYVVTSAAPEKVYSASVETFLSYVQRESQRAGGRSLFLIGHSHGGWLAMRVAYALRQIRTIPLLVTIDPISRTQCTPSRMVAAYFRSATQLRPEPGCTNSPPDFTSNQEKEIHSAVGWWKNFYQSQSPLLHSAYIGQAHKNTMLSFDVSSWLAYQAHVNIGSDARVWAEIERLTLQALP
ncbi:MAG: alpha/beta fold hydrolase [Deltaproteobacteria bacterium]|nr:MAG: alpha/beta fold hydrolase [Deltaproteobacteria bacterium]